ncbi:tryptophan--tRNA ligase [Oleiagrimonas sp. C23AA]|uniref:tryptophan--tRNA ligase n=1 Tax=Oleiagrimonas sp. C23AA TaxID=2719047 RepID=UPI001420EF53|nr:tryptophan--tRNA ligase [Oleiagrimonas sp. C23AA]NII11869.1 tryptophan--tRNA ligase [Oleiagrimonas sp. C23AA]
MNTRVLTGITTTGTPHLGNYVGAIRPAVHESTQEGVDAFFFMADYHALIKCDDPARVQRSRLEIAATWLAAGLDPARTTFYQQSDIPEIPELTWLLTCVTAKGLLNRAHAYKAAVDKNTESGEDADAGITAGLYMYPVLMAADILAFNANKVPVGRDQVQHIEMARDIAQRFNHLYDGDFFTLPEAHVEAHVATLPGLDGRKMSKSYDNTIPLFEGGPKRMREAISRIVTDSREPGEPKQAEGTALFTIYQAFASADEGAAFADALKGGMAWGEAKKQLFERLERDVAPMREHYDALMARPDEIADVLRDGAKKARAQATPLLERLREAVGLGQAKPAPVKKAKKKAAKRARFVSFREADGKFHFRFVDADGAELALSRGFDDPKAAGMATRALMGAEAIVQARDKVFVLSVGDDVLAESPAYADPAARDDAMARARQALASLADAD